MTKIAAYWAMSSVGGATAPPTPPMEPSLVNEVQLTRKGVRQYGRRRCSST